MADRWEGGLEVEEDAHRTAAPEAAVLHEAVDIERVLEPVSFVFVPAQSHALTAHGRPCKEAPEHVNRAGWHEREVR